MSPQRKAQALELEPLARMVELTETGTLAGLRDRALLLLGFAAALRRSELVAVDAEDLCFHGVRGLLVTVRGSKTDQHRQGELVAVPYAQDPERCAVRSVLGARRPDQRGQPPPRFFELLLIGVQQGAVGRTRRPLRHLHLLAGGRGRPAVAWRANPASGQAARDHQLDRLPGLATAREPDIERAQIPVDEEPMLALIL